MSHLRQPIRNYFFISLAIHLLAVGLFFIQPATRISSSESSLDVEPVEFEVSSAKNPVRSKGGSVLGRGSGKGQVVDTKKAQKILFGDQGLDWSKAGSAPSGGVTIQGQGGLQDETGSWGQQLDFKKNIELSVFFQRMLEKIDRTIDYPEDMAKERITGDVRVDFYLNRQGQLVGDFKSVKGSQTLLNLYVMASLLVVLKDPLPENLWAETDEKIAMSVHVHFETYQFSEMQILSQVHFAGNELVLRRARYVTPQMVEKVEKVFTRYVPPIIPIPGGFYVDLVMLMKYINNINTPDPDDERKKRLSVSREYLELVTKKNRAPLESYPL